MAIEVHTKPIAFATRGELLQLRALSKEGGEMRGVFDAVLAGEKAPSCWIAFARRSNGIIAWVTSSEWQGLQQVQAFTDERYRQQGFMRLLIDALLVDRAMYRCMRTASFSPAVTKALVAKGFLVEEYKRQDDSWALVTTEGEAC